MVHLGIENPFGQGLLQIIKQAIGLQSGSRVGAGQQVIEDGVRKRRQEYEGLCGTARAGSFAPIMPNPARNSRQSSGFWSPIPGSALWRQR
jgi:hypothetical protein